MNKLTDARQIKLPKHLDGDGILVVAEAEKVPFQIQRMFTVAAPARTKRGNHAHRLCSQFMLCVTGAVDVTYDNGKERKMFVLDRGELALLVPPGIWVEIEIKQNQSVLIVLCDRPYEEHDYIRDYAEFLSFRKTSQHNIAVSYGTRSFHAGAYRQAGCGKVEIANQIRLC
jgi:dTDP-4-dehydrorhamnose 3,5-epimerase-like enzyme